MTLQNILSICAIITGVVAVIELLEYVFTKNIPWLARLARQLMRWLRRRLGRTAVAPGQRCLVLNFSAHPIMPSQRQAIRTAMNWPTLEVIDAGLGNVPEDKDFVAEAINHLERIDLLPSEWQIFPMVVVPAGYAPVWSVLLAELHGRLGYFPDMVRLRPTLVEAEEKYEVAQIVSLREIRNQARAKR
ncbi:MAG: hypothetical protein JXM69_18070 [Anaerolineae bacterium]|nr:hypothetical protein [Anaerolineae bacterium]